jgi:hypothetical protein
MAIHRYSTKSEDEIKLDRYAKFRKLGDYADYPVVGGLWREARDERAKVNVQMDVQRQACRARLCSNARSALGSETFDQS